MQITLQSIVPVPLKSKLATRPSDVWNTNISFSKGDWVKIVAPSGTGKTTLTNIIYKIRHDYEGKVLYDQRDLKGIAGDHLAAYRQNNISIIFQDLRLFENLTARENIELNRVLQKPLYAAAIVDDMANTLGVAHILEQEAGLCSYGEQQRIAIIRALVQPFDILIMDEPFSHLDQDNARKAANLIASECEKRKAGFLLTDLDEDSLFDYSHKYSL